MKKVSRKIFGLLAASMLLAGAGAFVSCSNGSDSSSATGSGSGSNPASSGQTTTVSAVDSVATSGTAAVSGTTATLTASNGKYVLKAGQGTHNNIAAIDSPSATNEGTWTFTETGKTSPKYVGSYEGNIATIGFSATSLKLKVEKYLINGSLAAIVKEETFDISFASTSTEFSATIPAVKVSNVISYLLTKVGANYTDAQNYSLIAKLERIDASPNEKCVLSSLRSYRAQKNGASNEAADDNTPLNANGTYKIADGKLTGTFLGKTRTLTVNEDGNLYGTDDGEPLKYELISGSYKIYANVMTVPDGANSHARIRTVWLNEDAGKIGLIVDLKKTATDKTKPMIIATYEISGKTVTFTGTGDSAGQTKTATLSDDGKKLTLDDVEYLKM